MPVVDVYRCISIFYNDIYHVYGCIRNVAPHPYRKNDRAGGGGRGGWVLLYIKHIKSYKVKSNGWVLLYIECGSTLGMDASISQTKQVGLNEHFHKSD